eukprot:CAMPEP_0183319112 /NCGR_PEP_ID=MMETSP0160_2-20130417/62608_1 /TAXON_ID=2839 ORGANISM="Odontella Sinensis, Strain Grunow 1884" /NCGR_SAMPLE_ID=MMETSP0160_2 /ASSEMBLY_ACC=CAM_ASM_000250 /LENGTH=86 /DNA_ID=CAMNT_0025485529 /DNA_START=125 /DNA_END=385 /DNA_ORIENTATION=+
MGKGTIWAIVAWSCYFVSALLLCFTPSPEPLCCKKDDGSSKNCCGDKRNQDETQPQSQGDRFQQEGKVDAPPEGPKEGELTNVVVE